MKKILLLSAIIMLIGCKSNEDKATELITQEFLSSNQDLVDFKPISVDVSKAYNTVYNNPKCQELADILATYDVYKSTKSYDPGMEQISESEIDLHYLQLKRIIEKMDTTEILGWSVIFEYEMRNVYGNMEKRKNRYIVDQAFKKILYANERYESDNTFNNMINLSKKTTLEIFSDFFKSK